MSLEPGNRIAHKASMVLVTLGVISTFIGTITRDIFIFAGMGAFVIAFILVGFSF